MITIMRGDLEEEHIQLIKDEEEYVKQRYFAIARTLAEPIRITRKEAAEMLGLSVRQIKRIGSKRRE